MYQHCMHKFHLKGRRIISAVNHFVGMFYFHTGIQLIKKPPPASLLCVCVRAHFQFLC
uniref:Uncharacterized protein n=1 Tax=Anguilla anguilla TaxID=7936 RepID=A0A0E9VE05_ANGAN